MTIDLSAPNPLHQHSGPDTAWTTVNASENIPGVLTPLGADFWLRTVELGMYGAFRAFGVIPGAEVRYAQRPDDRFGGIVYGRFVGNIDTFRRLLDLTPGASGADFERQIFGSERAGGPARTNRLRYPVVAVKAPVLIARLPRLVHRNAAAQRAWWRAVTAEPGPGPSPVDLLREAAGRVSFSIEMQMVATMAGQTCYEKLGAVAAAAGLPERALDLASGYGDLEEARMISALHAVAHRGAPLADFLARYGARCPGENELSAYSWRERPELVRTLARKYRDAPGRADPAISAPERGTARQAAEREVLARLPRRRRPGARLLMRLARTYIPLREEGKSAMAMAMDAARCAARRRGRELSEAGVLDRAEDVFMLTLTELATPPADARDLVAQRTRLRTAYQDLELPVYWLGNPDPVPAAAPPVERAGSVSGIPAAAGVAQGRARVMTDADGIDELEDGEILVCRTTDPSWGAAFHLVSGAVIDIGGPASHGAIVSRELGLPCVINTGNGTAVLRTGDLLRVDGTSGVVTVLEALGADPPGESPVDVIDPSLGS